MEESKTGVDSQFHVHLQYTMYSLTIHHTAHILQWKSTFME